MLSNTVNMWSILSVGAAIVLIAGVTLFVSARPASAPEPARLTQPLNGPNGATGGAYYTSSNKATTVVRWPASWTYNTTLQPGTPCTTVNMEAGEVTTKVIHAYGNYRKCA